MLEPCPPYISTSNPAARSVLKTAAAGATAPNSSTEPLYVCWAIDDGEVQTWRSGDPPIPFDPSWDAVAHNYEFERPFYELILIPRHSFPVIPLERWHCSMRLALANAYPAELGLLSQALGLPYRKDPKAVKALREVSRPRKKGDGWDEDPDKLALVHARCVLDVITTRAVWTHPKLRRLSESERRLQLLDAEINRRGVRIDRAFVEAARTLAANERNTINVRISELTEGEITSVNQVQRLRAAVNARGHAMATLGKRSVATVLAHDPDDHVRELLELRRDGARASVRKFTRILDYAADDRLRGTLRMYGATTGRWTSPGPQLHNLRRNELGLPLVGGRRRTRGRPRPPHAIRLSAEHARQCVARCDMCGGRLPAVLGRLSHDRKQSRWRGSPATSASWRSIATMTAPATRTSSRIA